MKHKKRLTIELYEKEIPLIRKLKMKCLSEDKDMRVKIIELIKGYIR